MLKSFILLISDLLAILIFVILHTVSIACNFISLVELATFKFVVIGVWFSPKYICFVLLFPLSSSAYITYKPSFVADVYFTFTSPLSTNSISSPVVLKSILSSYFSFLAIFINLIILLLLVICMFKLNKLFSSLVNVISGDSAGSFIVM